MRFSRFIVLTVLATILASSVPSPAPAQEDRLQVAVSTPLLADIVRNSILFHERWGSWPMAGWLEAFRREELIEWTPSGNVLRLTAKGRAVAVPSPP